MKTNISILCALLVGCTADEQAQPDNTVEPVEEEIEEVEPVEEEPAPACVPDEDGNGLRFQGQIEYPDGTIANGGNTRIHMCSGSCKIAKWGQDGFCYSDDNLSPGIYSFKVVPYGMEAHATLLSFITIEEEGLVLEEPVVVPEFTNTEEVIDGVFDAGYGLEINVVAENYLPYFDDENQISAVHVDPIESGLPLAGLDLDKVVGVWHLGSFDADIDPIWSFKLHETGLPEGTMLKIMNSSYSDRKWLDAGTATVDADGAAVTDFDSGISTLSTLIILQD